jgi:hypothetical protein
VTAAAHSAPRAFGHEAFHTHVLGRPVVVGHSARHAPGKSAGETTHVHEAGAAASESERDAPKHLILRVQFREANSF